MYINVIQLPVYAFNTRGYVIDDFENLLHTNNLNKKSRKILIC